MVTSEGCPTSWSRCARIQDNGRHTFAGDKLVGLAEKHGAKVLFILNTHGHPDSTADDDSIRKATGAKIAIFEVEAPRLEKNARTSRWFLPAPPPAVKPDVLLKEGSELK